MNVQAAAGDENLDQMAMRIGEIGGLMADAVYSRDKRDRREIYKDAVSGALEDAKKAVTAEVAADDEKARIEIQKRITMLERRMADALHDGDEGVFERLKKDAVEFLRGPDSNFNPAIYVVNGSPCIWASASMVDAAGKADVCALEDVKDAATVKAAAGEEEDNIILLIKQLKQVGQELEQEHRNRLQAGTRLLAAKHGLREVEYNIYENKDGKRFYAQRHGDRVIEWEPIYQGSDSDSDSDSEKK